MRARLCLLTLLIVALWVPLPSAADGPYQLIKDVPIGGDGGWDYLNVDLAAKRLYISHATKVVVFDLTKDAIAGEIADTPGVHGAVAAFGDRIVTSNGRGNNASIVDAKTFQTISKVTTEGNPDFIMYEPKQKEVYTFNGSGKSASVIDASGKVVATIPLGGKPEAGVPDTAAGRVYVNNETGNEIIVIDVAKHEVVARWPIAPGESDVPIGPGVDSTQFDPGTGYAFSSCGGGDGSVTIAHEDAPDKLTVVQTLKTERGARTMGLDPATHRIYVAAVKYTEPAAGGGRAQMVPGSMHLLVYGINGK